MRIFLAFPRDTSPFDEERVKEKLSLLLPGLKQEAFRSSSEEYFESFSRFGSWEQWIDHVATGKNYMTQEPVFTHYICAEQRVGRATSEIVRLALERGKFVYLLAKEELKKVVSVHPIDDQDWQTGWQLTI